MIVQTNTPSVIVKTYHTPLLVSLHTSAGLGADSAKRLFQAVQYCRVQHCQRLCSFICSSTPLMSGVTTLTVSSRSTCQRRAMVGLQHGKTASFGSSCALPSTCVYRLPHVHSVKRCNHRLIKLYASHNDGSQQQSAWSLPWPFKPSTADECETEYEIVYVTDNGTEDEHQQSKEEATLHVTEGHQQQVPPAAAEGLEEQQKAQQQVYTADNHSEHTHEVGPSQ